MNTDEFLFYQDIRTLIQDPNAVIDGTRVYRALLVKIIKNTIPHSNIAIFNFYDDPELEYRLHGHHVEPAFYFVRIRPISRSITSYTSYVANLVKSMDEVVPVFDTDMTMSWRERIAANDPVLSLMMVRIIGAHIETGYRWWAP